MGYVLVKAAPAAGAVGAAALRAGGAAALRAGGAALRAGGAATLRAGGALASKIGVKGAVRGAVGVKTLQSLNNDRNQAKDTSESVSPSDQNQGQYAQLAAETRQMLRDKASTNPTQFP